MDREQQPFEDIEVRGHIIDSLLLPKILDVITTGGGSFSIDEIAVGQSRHDSSYARVRISADDDEQLNEILRQAKWEGIVGTWVDAETGGRNITTTYTWKFKDRVIEANTRMAGREDVSLIGVNSKTGEVFNMSASSDGSASLGSWNFESNGDAVRQYRDSQCQK